MLGSLAKQTANNLSSVVDHGKLSVKEICKAEPESFLSWKLMECVMKTLSYMVLR